MQKIETALVLIALATLWPYIVGFKPWWYQAWMVVVLGLMAWVAVRRLGRIRAAADEAKKIREEQEKGRRPPFIQQ